MSITIEQFVARLTQSGLMSAAEIAAFQDSLPREQRPNDGQQFAQALVQHGKLTRYQAQAVYQGKTKGLVFGEYVVLDKLGEGGMGVVLKAQHRRMDRLVAIKVLSATAMKQAGSVERFQREVKMAAKLSHPNIVTAYDAGEHQGMHYLAMEYVEGKDLASIVKEHGPLGVREAVERISQAARGLQYAHDKGVIHRDIKPGNLLLDKAGTVKILDMGLARITGADTAVGGPERLTTTGQVMGTCDYMSPEQAMDSHHTDQRTDIYALGCTLYRLLTGHPPYRGETLMEILLAHRESPIPSLCGARPGVPAELDACFRRMMAKQPGDRQQSMTEVAEELDAVLAVLSGRAAVPIAAVPIPLGAESSGGTLAQTLSFLQEDAPAGTLTRRKKLTAPEETQPSISRQETGTNVAGKLKRSGGAVRRKPLVLAALGGGLVLLLGMILTISLRRGTLVVEIDEQLGKDVQVAVSQGGNKVQLADARSGWTLSLGAGKYDLAVEGGDDRFQLDAQTVTVTRGGQVKVRVTLKPKRVPLPPGEGRGEGTPGSATTPFDARQAREYQERRARQLGVPIEFTNSLSMELALIPPGNCLVGTSDEEMKKILRDVAELGVPPSYFSAYQGSEEVPQRPVTIAGPFYLGKCEVTIAQFRQFVRDAGYKTDAEKGKSVGQTLNAASQGWEESPNASWEHLGRVVPDSYPATNVTWHDATAFCEWLSGKEGQTYRLPTETEWEYACRAQSTTRYHFGDDAQQIDDFAWYGNMSGKTANSVGQKKPNPWGLYDMYGNVWEWCYDTHEMTCYADNQTSIVSTRPIRGGAWDTEALRCRSGYSQLDKPTTCCCLVGFRVACFRNKKTPPPAAEAGHGQNRPSPK